MFRAGCHPLAYSKVPSPDIQTIPHFILPVESLPPAIHVYVMFNPSGESASDNPNAPQIPPLIYRWEEGVFGGTFVAAVLYGVVIALFFKCMAALLGPVGHIRGCIKWGLAAHTVAMFSFLTIPTAIYFGELSNFYIDNRKFPGDDEYPPGPIGYSDFSDFKAIDTVHNTMFPLNQWLSDGLLLHRCYVIHSMNRRIITFPCLIYLISVAMGITYIYKESTPGVDDGIKFGTSYFSVSFSLNILLTLMIITRLVLHRRSFQNGLRTKDGGGGLHAALITIFIESYALYAITFLLYIPSWATNSWVATVLSKFVGPAQVIAPYLVILRVADRRALTGGTVAYVPRSPSSSNFMTQGSSDGDRTLIDGDPASPTKSGGEVHDEPSTDVTNVIEEVRL